MSKYKIIEETKRNGDVRYYVLKRRLFMWFIQTESPINLPCFSLFEAKQYIKKLISEESEEKTVGKKVVYATNYKHKDGKLGEWHCDPSKILLNYLVILKRK